METTKIITSEYTIKLRNLEISDYPDIKEAAELAYSGMGGIWQPKHIAKLLEIFPEGQLCTELNGKVIACALSWMVNYSRFGDAYTYAQLTGNYEFTTHNSDELPVLNPCNN